MSIVLSQPLGQLWNEFERAHNEMNRVLQHIDTRDPAGKDWIDHVSSPLIEFF